MHHHFVARIGVLLLSVFALDATSRAADWSPSGKQLTFWADWAGNLEAYVINLDGTGLKNLTNHPAEDANPVWSPDGRQIVYISTREGRRQIYIMNADGTGQKQLTDNGYLDMLNPKWSSDGQRITFHSLFVDFGVERGAIYTMNRDGSDVKRLTEDDVYNFNPFFSPDGKQISFNTADATELINIHTMSADGTNRVNLTQKTR